MKAESKDKRLKNGIEVCPLPFEMPGLSSHQYCSVKLSLQRFF